MEYSIVYFQPPETGTVINVLISLSEYKAYIVHGQYQVTNVCFYQSKTSPKSDLLMEMFL